MQLEPLVGAVGFEVDVSSLKQGEDAARSFAAAAGVLGDALGQMSAGASGTGDALAGISSGAGAAAQGLESTASAGAAASSSYSGVAEKAGSAGSSLGQVGGQASAASAGVGELASNTAQTASGLGDVAAASQRAEDGFEGLGSAAGKAGEGVGRVGGFADKAKAGVLALGIGLAGIGAAARGVDAIKGPLEGVARSLGSAVSAAAEYDQAITSISTLGPEAAARQDEFKTKVLEVSTALGQDAVKGARAAYDAISSGVKAGDAIAFLGTAGKAATAGLSTMDTAGKALTVTLNSYNLEASETTSVSDALFQAANVGVTTFDELATSFGGVASIAAASGASYKETLASLAQITTKGASTSEAVTQLKSIFTALAKPDAAIADALEKQGFASADAAIKAKGLQYVLELVRQTSEDTGKPLIELVGRTEAVNAVLATTGVNAGLAREKVDALANSAGSTESAFALLSETPAHQMALFETAVSSAKIALGDALLPVLGTVLDALTPLVQGFSSFASNVLSPLGQAFAALPQPVTLLVVALGGLAAAGAVLVTGIAGVAAVAAPVVGAFGAGSVAAGVFSGTLGVMGTAASGAGAALAGALGPIGIAVAVLGSLYVAVGRANEALDGQFGALDKSSAGFDDYAAAVARAKDEAGLLGGIGIQLKGGFAAVGDEVTEASAGYRLAGELIGDLWGAMTGGDEATGAAAAGLEATADAARLSANEIVLAGQAWLEQGTNIQPAVLASEQFSLAQARLNNALRDGSISQDEYKTKLLEAANAASLAQGAGAVLSAQQQNVAAAFTETLTSMAASSGALSEANLQSEGLAEKQAVLANAVAAGTISTQQATEEFQAYVAELANSDSATQAAIQANSALSSGYDELLANLSAGQIGYQEAAAQLQALGEQAGATEEQMASMNDVLQGAALSPELAGFGVSLDFESIADPEKLAEKMDEARATANESIQGLFSEQLQARQAFQTQEQELLASRGPAMAEAEAQAQAAIAEARAAGDEGRVAEIQAGLAEELAAISAGNEQKLANLRQTYETERQERLNAIAQAAIDQLNSLLSLGQISEQQAQLIFGSLKAAAPDSHLFDPAAQAAIQFSATLGQAFGGNTEAAVGLTDAFLNIDASLAESEAAAAAYEAESVQAYQNAKAGIEGTAAATGPLVEGYNAVGAAAAVSGDGSVVAADLEVESNQRRIDSGIALADTTSAVAGQITTAAGVVGASSTALADLDTAEQQRRLDALVAAGQITDAEYARMSAALSSAASASSSSTGDMVGDTQRLRSEATQTGAVVDQNVRGIGTSYLAGAAGVREGSQGIVTETAKANQSLAGLGSGVPGQLAPATESVAQLRGGVQLLAEDVEGAARQRADADEGAARAATGAAEDTVQGFSKVQQQGVDTREEIDQLKDSMEALPKKIEIPLTSQGIKEMRAELKALTDDLKAIQTAATIRIYGEYIPKNKPMEPGGSLMLQHDVEDALAAAEPGLRIVGVYDGTGGMAWGDGALAITDAIDQARAGATDPIVLRAVLDVGEGFGLLLFDAEAEAASLAAAQAEITRLEALVASLDTQIKGIEQTRLAEVFALITSALNAFFDAGKGVEGSLANVLDLMGRAGQQATDAGNLIASAGLVVSEADFLKGLGFDVSSFDELQARIDSLSGEPDKQREMWQAVVKGLTDDWKRFYEDQKQNLADQKKSLEGQKNLLGTDADTSAIDAKIDAIAEAMSRLDERNRQITDGLGEQSGGLGRMLDAYNRINDEVEELAKAQALAARELADHIKEQEGLIKDRQRASTEAEKDAHEQAMDLLDDEVKARDKAHKAEMSRLDQVKKRTEDDIERRIAAEQAALDSRLAAITAEVDAADKLNDAEEDRLNRAKLLVASAKTGKDLTSEQADFLRSMGIDPAQLLKTNVGLNQTKTLIDETQKSIDNLSKFIDKLPAGPGRIRLAGGALEREDGRPVRDSKGAPQTLSQAERDELQKGIDSGALTGSDARIARVALAGGVVQAQRLREVLATLLGPKQDANQAAKDAVELAGQEVDLVAKLLADREAVLKVAQDEAKSKRESLAQQIADEKKLFEDFKKAQNDRLVAIDAEKARVKEAYDDYKTRIAEAKDAEQDRHEARMKQIAAEYALELLRLGNTEAEVQRILTDQAERAAAIAVEAERRFREILAAAGAEPVPQPPNPFGPPPTPPPGIAPPVNPPITLGVGGSVTDSTDGGFALVGGEGQILAVGIDRLVKALGAASSQWAEFAGAGVVLTAAQTAAVAAAASTTINNRTLQNWGPIINGQGADSEAWLALMDFLGVAP